MKKAIQNHPYWTLLTLALCSGLIWRGEVEYQGWAGLTWITYFHWALPLGLGLFFLWANLMLEMETRRRIGLNVAATLFGIFLYLGMGTSLTYLFAGGPSGYLLLMQTPEWLIFLFRFSLFGLLPGMPVGAFLLLKYFKLKPKALSLLFAILGVILSIPVTSAILFITGHKGGYDELHVLKSGVLVPFWVFSMGLLVIAARPKGFK